MVAINRAENLNEINETPKNYLLGLYTTHKIAAKDHIRVGTHLLNKAIFYASWK